MISKVGVTVTVGVKVKYVKVICVKVICVKVISVKVISVKVICVKVILGVNVTYFVTVIF